MKTKKGFTLIEILIYMTIFGVVISVVVSTGLFLATESQKSIMREQMIAEASTIFSEITRYAATGKTFNAGASSLSQDFSVFAFTDAAGTSKKLDVANGFVRKTTGNAAAAALNSADLTVTRFYVERINPNNFVPVYKFEMDFTNPVSQSYSLSTAINFIYD